MSMFSRFAIPLTAAAAITAAAPVSAQDVDLVARVPFEFTVANSALPRDTYQLSRLDGHPEMLLVRGDRKGVFVRTEEMGRQRDNVAPSLLFHRYGNQYFLREIRLEGNARLDLPETKAEREAAEGRADRAAVLMEKVAVSAERR
jgi:hypothetical protein